VETVSAPKLRVGALLDSGGGIANDFGTAMLKNTIIANSTSGGNCSNTGTLIADSHNLADDGTCGDATQATSAQINLQLLANNGVRRRGGRDKRAASCRSSVPGNKRPKLHLASV